MMAADPLDRALAAHREGRLAEAEPAYRAVLEQGDARAEFPLAVVLLQLRRNAEAAERFAALSAAQPDNADVWNNLSIALRLDGRLDDALHAAERARALAPDKPATWNALGLAALALSRDELALSAFDAGLRIAPDYPVFVLHRVQCLRRLLRNEEALTALTRFLRVNPGHVDAWRALGSLQSAMGQFDEAARIHGHARNLDPQNRDIAVDYGTALMYAGRASAARHVFEEEVQRENGSAWLWSLLSRARLAEGDRQAASMAAAEARRLDPANPVIAHLDAAFRGQMVEEVERDYVRALFDDFADHFEVTLHERLGYGVPLMLKERIEHLGFGATSRALDIGCGTGLMGVELAKPGRQIDGIDLSPRMLSHARSKNVYRELHEAEILQFLQTTDRTWDLIVAADVLIYLAHLAPVFVAVAERLDPGGAFAFSIENSASGATELPPETGRYRHVPEQVAAQLECAGFAILSCEAKTLRMERGAPVAGTLFVAQKNA